MADTQLPLLGVILCCTSIPPEKRSDIAAIASQMGAVHKLDLTSDVTHLIVGDTDTPKYKFVAKERPDVRCVLETWIEAVRASWLEGGETRVEELEQAHRLLTFTGLRLCVTGFDDLIYRKQLEDAINDNGGDYRGNLTKDVTHLVAKEPTGAKYNYAGQWGIKTVGVEWLEQSLERGMILDESSYHLSIPPAERGRNAWIRKSEPLVSLGKRPRVEEIVPQNSRKLRRTASARLSSQNVGLWSELVAAPFKTKEESAGAWGEQTIEPAEHRIKPPPQYAEDVASVPSVDNTRAPLKKSLSEANLGTFLGRPLSSEGLFHGKTIALNGFEQKKATIIQEHLRSHGAKVVEEVSDLPPISASNAPGNRLVLVPYNMLASDAPLNPDPIGQWTVVTDMWVERCIYKKKIESPQGHATSTPFPSFPIAGFKSLAICSTGFQGVDLLHASKAVKLIGGSYEEYFTPKSSVLVCNSVVPGHEKLAHAGLWSIPAVKPSWLWDSIRKGDLMPFRPYLVQPIINPNVSKQGRQGFNEVDSAAQAKDKAGDSRERRRFNKTDDQQTGSSSNLTLQRGYSGGRNIVPSSPKPASREHEPEPSAIYLDDDTPILPDSNTENHSSVTLTAPSIPAPLREITPNSSPPKPSESFSKPSSPIKTKDPPPSESQDPPPASEDSSLGPAISSLLAHHQRSKHDRNQKNNEKAQPSNSSDPSNPYRRRRRQLFGRAPSNLSAHSINLSRASSVDTMNTDGLGTPLEPSASTNKNSTTASAINTNNNPNPSTTDLSLNLYTASNVHADDPDRLDPAHMQMTQLGYEDPDVAAWRERVSIKMSGGKVKEGKGGTTPGRKSGGEVGVGGIGTGAGGGRGGKGGGGGGGGGKGESLGIAKRTRLATRG